MSCLHFTINVWLKRRKKKFLKGIFGVTASRERGENFNNEASREHFVEHSTLSRKHLIPSGHYFGSVEITRRKKRQFFRDDLIPPTYIQLTRTIEYGDDQTWYKSGFCPLLLTPYRLVTTHRILVLVDINQILWVHIHTYMFNHSDCLVEWK